MRDLHHRKNDNNGSGRYATYAPPRWLTTDQLEDELFDAIMHATPADPDDVWGAIDEYFAADIAWENEVERRQSLLRLLGLLRPQLGKLLASSSSES